MHLTLILLDIPGLDRVEDVEQLEADHGSRPPRRPLSRPLILPMIRRFAHPAASSPIGADETTLKFVSRCVEPREHETHDQDSGGDPIDRRCDGIRLSRV